MAKKAKKFGNKQAAHMIQKDDGTRWAILNSAGRNIYLDSGGMRRQDAERLSQTLAQPNKVVQLNVEA